MQALRADGCNVMDLTGNELAKAHARHLVGGRSPNAADELLYRFEFPERRGGTLKRPGLPAARVPATRRRSRGPAARSGPASVPERRFLTARLPGRLWRRSRARPTPTPPAWAISKYI